MRFSVSNLFVIMGMNYFKKFDKVLFSVWKSHNMEDYFKYTEQIKEKKPDIISKHLSSKKQLEQYQEKYKFNIAKDIQICQNSSSSKLIEKNKDKTIKSLPKLIKLEDKKDIEKLIIDSSNTIFGIKNENSAIKVFETQQKCKVLNSQNMSCIDIKCPNDGVITLVGKIDGITDNDEIVEVKNRVKKHFKTLRPYEKPQIMSYLWMHKKQKGYMVENLKINNTTCDINIIAVNYETNYVENNVIPQLHKFHAFFLKFMENEEWKYDLLEGKQDKLYDIFMEDDVKCAGGSVAGGSASGGNKFSF